MPHSYAAWSRPSAATVRPGRRRQRSWPGSPVPYIADNALGWSLPYEPEYAFTQSYLRGFVPNFGTGNVIGPVAQAWLAK